MAEALSPILPPALEALTQQVLNEACLRELKLATAESCTGGLIASLLTDVPGCSHAFERGFVVYTNEAKNELLGVPEALLEDPGPVSEEVARAMAEGALSHSSAHVAISVTGFAGAGAPGDEPGLVHFALARRDGQTIHRMERFGDIGRGGVRLECARTCISMLREEICAAEPVGR